MIGAAARLPRRLDGGMPYSTYPLDATGASTAGAVLPAPFHTVTSLAGVACSGAPVICGDVDGDWTATVLDVLELARALAGLVTLSPAQIDAADVAGHRHPHPDAVLDVADVIRIDFLCKGIIPSLDCCP